MYNSVHNRIYSIHAVTPTAHTNTNFKYPTNEKLKYTHVSIHMPKKTQTQAKTTKTTLEIKMTKEEIKNAVTYLINEYGMISTVERLLNKYCGIDVDLDYSDEKRALEQALNVIESLPDVVSLKIDINDPTLATLIGLCCENIIHTPCKTLQRKVDYYTCEDV